jgi:chromosome segregation ATPase
MSRRLSRIGQGVGPYLKPSFISKLKCDDITSLNLHCNNLEDLKVRYYSSKAKNEQTEKGEIEFLSYPDVIKANELTLLVDLDVSSNKLGEVIVKEENCVGEKGDDGVSLLLLAPNLKTVNLSANAISSEDLDRTFQPLMVCDIHTTTIFPSPLRKLHCLNLSFNELRSLPECFHIVCPSLCSLIIVGNFISNFSCFVKSLYPLRETLAIIMLQESDKTSPNPICTIPLYRERIIRLFPFLQLFDGEHVLETEKSEAAMKVESFIFEQHITDKGDISNAQPKSKLKEKTACDRNAVLRVKERVSKERNVVTRKGGACFERGSLTLPAAPVVTLCPQRDDTGNTSSKRIDELELKMKQLRVAVEDQVLSTKFLLKAEQQIIDHKKQKDYDDIVKQQDNDRSIVHQGCQVDEKLVCERANQESQVQTDRIYCINSEVQTAAQPTSKPYMADGRLIAFDLIHRIRKKIRTRRMTEDALRALSFQLWGSNKDALKRKDQVQKMQQHCKKVSLEKKKLKGSLMECQESLHFSENQQGELQQKVSHLLNELKEQQQKGLICEKNYASLLEELKEAKNKRAQSSVSIKHMQSRLESIEKQRVEEFDRAEGLLVTLGEYKLKCSSLQSEIKEVECKRAYLDVDIKHMQSKVESIEMQRMEEYDRAEGLLISLGDCTMKCSSLQSELNAAQQQIEKIKKSNETRIKEIEQEHQDSLKRTLEEALEQNVKELSLTREKVCLSQTFALFPLL